MFNIIIFPKHVYIIQLFRIDDIPERYIFAIKDNYHGTLKYL